jgi:HAMP domain-containing protein
MTLLQVICALAAVCAVFAWSSRAQAQSLEDIRRNLDRIRASETPAPTMGAMCYEIALPAEYQEFICPRDGEKTAYAQGSRAYWQVNSLQEIKNLLSELRPLAKDLSFTLDERALCAKCTPGLADQERQAALIIRYAEGREVRTSNITAEDIRYLIGFFKGALTYTTDNDGQTPLKEIEPRLKEILGE